MVEQGGIEERKHPEIESPIEVLSPKIFEKVAVMAETRFRRIDIERTNPAISSISWMFRTQRLGSVYEIAISGSPRQTLIGQPGLAVNFSPVPEIGIELPEYDIETDQLSFHTADRGGEDKGVIWIKGLPDSLEVAHKEGIILQFLEEADTRPHNDHIYIRATMPEWHPAT